MARSTIAWNKSPSGALAGEFWFHKNTISARIIQREKLVEWYVYGGQLNANVVPIKSGKAKKPKEAKEAVYTFIANYLRRLGDSFQKPEMDPDADMDSVDQDDDPNEKF
jgi:hypothetical protein